MSKVLVTGSSGFVGLHLTEELLKQGYEVRCLVRPVTNQRRLNKLGKNVKSGKLEIREVISLSNPKYLHHIASAIKGVDQVFHLAAATHGTKEELHNSNVETTRNLINACNYSGISRFNMMSSLAARATKDDSVPISSQTPYNSVSNYGASKLESEKIVVSSSIPHTVYAPTVVVGEGDREMKPVYEFIKQRGFTFKIGTSNQQISFIYVKDLVGALLLGSQSKETFGKSYVLSDGKSTSQIDYLRMIGNSVGRPNLNIYPLPVSLAYATAGLVDVWSHLSDTNSMLSFSKVNELKRSWICSPSTDFMQATSWKPKIDLEESVRRTARWICQGT